MKFEEVMQKLEELGTAQARKIYKRHGCDINQFGVSIANLKKVLKPIKNDSELGLQLLKSKNADAIYLSQWIVDQSKLTIDDLRELINTTEYYMILDSVVPNIVIENKPLAWRCLHEWIDHPNFRFRQSAYSLYGLILSKYPNDEINNEDVIKRVEHVKNVIHNEQNRVRYSMNSFVIAAGIYNAALTDFVKEASTEIGKVEVFMGETSCKVPFAPDYIEKVKSMNRIGKKR